MLAQAHACGSHSGRLLDALYQNIQSHFVSFCFDNYFISFCFVEPETLTQLHACGRAFDVNQTICERDMLSLSKRTSFVDFSGAMHVWP